MTDNQLKSLIGQNCEEYSAKVPQHFMRIGFTNESCYNCYYYIAGQCSKNLYNDMENIFTTN
ncbi:hypothetical protein [Clostridium fallax]|uniref:Uncharacterized protein n=1 Tax=Clostridium fallax TaxID=1533 RepID=A0A1M4W5B1_9CLOT|nr:hypothetical protein [Clostridium fallax]SHE76451.1 hypothetical protein SAMN05443638_11075 [Clostridium fallax]SQB22891.1 Uncharacterised protein [Clostridium fallax]